MELCVITGIDPFLIVLGVVVMLIIGIIVILLNLNGDEP
jgi:hypothetical protein